MFCSSCRVTQTFSVVSLFSHLIRTFFTIQFEVIIILNSKIASIWSTGFLRSSPTFQLPHRHNILTVSRITLEISNIEHGNNIVLCWKLYHIPIQTNPLWDLARPEFLNSQLVVSALWKPALLQMNHDLITRAVNDPDTYLYPISIRST